LGTSRKGQTVVVLAVEEGVPYPGSKDEMENESRNRRIPKGTGMAIGMAFGLLIGIALDNGGMGLLFGVACGSGFEAFFGQQRKMKDGSSQDGEKP